MEINKKLLFGVGDYTKGKFFCKQKGRQSKVYTTWVNMIRRCYCKDYQKVYPSYKNTYVAYEWHNFQNFAKWYEENYIEGFDLDKDILCKNCRVYSPVNCCFVPREINILFKRKLSRQNDLPEGINKSGRKFRARITVDKKRVCLGIFEKLNDAKESYKKAKENLIKVSAKKYKRELTKEVFNKLMEYKYE